MQTNRITLLVNDLDRAITFYTDAFGLTLVENTQISETKRIVLVATSPNGVRLNLATPKSGDEALVGLRLLALHLAQLREEVPEARLCSHL